MPLFYITELIQKCVDCGKNVGGAGRVSPSKPTKGERKQLENLMVRTKKCKHCQGPTEVILQEREEERDETPVRMVPPERKPGSGRIAELLPCPKCGTGLNSVQRRGYCPECGSSYTKLMKAIELTKAL